MNHFTVWDTFVCKSRKGKTIMREDTSRAVFDCYATASDCLLFFPSDCFECWKESFQSIDFDTFLRGTISKNLIPPTTTIVQQNGTKKEIPAWTISVSLTEKLLRATTKLYEEYTKSPEYLAAHCWSTFNVEKKSDEDFKSVLHELTYKLTDREEKMFGYWIWQVVNKLRGHFPEMPTFLGLVGKVGDGKDSTLGQFQLALKSAPEDALIPEGHSMSVFDNNFQTLAFYSQGVVRFEEISSRRKSDIDTFKTKITNPTVVINEKFHSPFVFLSRNSYCGTANESYQCMVNDTENRRIIEIKWKSIKGEVSLKEVRGIFNRLIACCPEEEIYDTDEIFKYIHEQFDGDITLDKIWSSEELRTVLTSATRIRVGQVKQYLGCSFAEARKFLQDTRYFEYVESGKYYKVDTLKLLDALNAE